MYGILGFHGVCLVCFLGPPVIPPKTRCLEASGGGVVQATEPSNINESGFACHRMYGQWPLLKWLGVFFHIQAASDAFF